MPFRQDRKQRDYYKLGEKNKMNSLPAQSLTVPERLKRRIAVYATY